MKAPWCPEVQEVEGKTFLRLVIADRGIAAALGTDLGSSNPLRGVDIFQYLTRKRDDEVDRYIHEFQMNNDPMGKARRANAVRVTKGRDILYTSAEVPQIIGVDVPAFTTEDDTTIEAIHIEMLSTPKRSVAPQIMINASVLEWLAYAIHHEWIVQQKRVACSTLDLGFTLPELPLAMKY